MGGGGNVNYIAVYKSLLSFAASDRFSPKRDSDRNIILEPRPSQDSEKVFSHADKVGGNTGCLQPCRHGFTPRWLSVTKTDGNVVSLY
jgi:hypothetical protein